MAFYLGVPGIYRQMLVSLLISKTSIVTDLAKSGGFSSQSQVGKLHYQHPMECTWNKLPFTISSRYSCFWRCISLEYDRSPFTKIGMALTITRLCMLYISFYLVTLQCLTLSVRPFFMVIILCDVYLIFYWYITLNATIYVNGAMVTDRRIIFRQRVRTRLFWDILTLFPFEVMRTGNLHQVDSASVWAIDIITVSLDLASWPSPSPSKQSLKNHIKNPKNF